VGKLIGVVTPVFVFLPKPIWISIGKNATILDMKAYLATYMVHQCGPMQDRRLSQWESCDSEGGIIASKLFPVESIWEIDFSQAEDLPSELMWLRSPVTVPVGLPRWESFPVEIKV
jgi:hypothetical protein